jgi:hypothetical protein
MTSPRLPPELTRASLQSQHQYERAALMAVAFQDQRQALAVLVEARDPSLNTAILSIIGQTQHACVCVCVCVCVCFYVSMLVCMPQRLFLTLQATIRQTRSMLCAGARLPSPCGELRRLVCHSRLPRPCCSM